MLKQALISSKAFGFSMNFRHWACTVSRIATEKINCSSLLANYVMANGLKLRNAEVVSGSVSQNVYSHAEYAIS